MAIDEFVFWGVLVFWRKSAPKKVDISPLRLRERNRERFAYANWFVTEGSSPKTFTGETSAFFFLFFTGGGGVLDWYVYGISNFGEMAGGNAISKSLC
jgi:hypothetical protein